MNTRGGGADGGTDDGDGGGIVVRAVDPGEFPTMIPVMDGVMMRAYDTGSFLPRIERFAAVQPDGLFVAESPGADGGVTVIGAGCGVAYPDGGFGWIGLIAVDPSHHRRGIGERLTERVAEMLASMGCAALLDASAAGGPLYERMGFVDHGPTIVMTPSKALLATPPPSDGLNPVEVDIIGPFDSAHFGASRERSLQVAVEQSQGRHAMALDGHGRVTGYVIAEQGGIGPLVATSTAAMARLIGYALALPNPVIPRLCVPPGSRFHEWLTDLGFVEARRLRHMRRGVTLIPGDESSIAGRLSLGEG